MKTADILPVHKSSSRFLSTNYRPISLILNMQRFLRKRIKYVRILDFVNEKGTKGKNRKVHYPGWYCDHWSPTGHHT